MTASLLPSDFDQRVAAAVRCFWTTRAEGSDRQEGTRGQVIGGKNLDGFLALFRAVAEHHGLPHTSVFHQGKADLSLPGFYRPIKNWDALIVHRGQVVAAVEFKSQVGSFGNNFNNRTEEAIGNASDLLAAWASEAYRADRHRRPATVPNDPRRPFLGYLMLLEDCPASTRPVRAESRHYPVLPEFENTSYAERYRILCEMLIAQGLYGAAALHLTPAEGGRQEGVGRSLGTMTSIQALFEGLAFRLLHI